MNVFENFMISGGWALYALLSTVFIAGFLLVNQYMKQRGILLVLVMRFAVIFALFPVAVTLQWPREPAFYLIMLATVFCGVLPDVRTINVAAKYGSGVASRLTPLTVLAGFFLWFAVDPHLLMVYAADPWRALVIVFSLCGCIWFSVRQNACHVSRSALREMLPAMAGYTLIIAFNKLAMNYGIIHDTVYIYIFLQCVLAVPVLMLVLYSQRRHTHALPTIKKRVAAGGVAMAAAWGASMVLKNYSMAYTPNPAYTAAIQLLSPLFIALFYAVVKHKEEGDVKNGMGVVACIIVLTLAVVH